MYKFLTKYGTMLGFGVGLVISVLALITILGGLDGFNALPEEEQGTTSIFNLGLGGAVALIILCAVGIVLFGIYNLITHPKAAVKFLIGVGLLLGLVLIFYSMSEVETTGKVYTEITEGRLTGGASRVISGALTTVLVLAGLAALAFVVSEIRNLFK